LEYLEAGADILVTSSYQVSCDIAHSGESLGFLLYFGLFSKFMSCNVSILLAFAMRDELDILCM